MHQARRPLTLARLDCIVLVVVVFDMVLKPTGDDTGAPSSWRWRSSRASRSSITRVRALDAATA